MALSSVHQVLPLEPVLLNLIELRKEWQEATGSETLDNVTASVSLLLSDVITAIGLSPLDRERVLGKELADALQDAPERAFQWQPV
jgi:hypothetical protein